MDSISQGAHEYRGGFNSRAKRQNSKLHSGIKSIRKEVWQQVEMSLGPCQSKPVRYKNPRRL
jgi:hypothetical protein